MRVFLVRTYPLLMFLVRSHRARRRERVKKKTSWELKKAEKYVVATRGENTDQPQRVDELLLLFYLFCPPLLLVVIFFVSSLFLAFSFRHCFRAHFMFRRFFFLFLLFFFSAVTIVPLPSRAVLWYIIIHRRTEKVQQADGFFKAGPVAAQEIPALQHSQDSTAGLSSAREPAALALARSSSSGSTTTASPFRPPPPSAPNTSIPRPPV